MSCQAGMAAKVEAGAGSGSLSSASSKMTVTYARNVRVSVSAPNFLVNA